MSEPARPDEIRPPTPSRYQFSFTGDGFDAGTGVLLPQPVTVYLDVYRLLEIAQVTRPAFQHAIKKLIRAGQSLKGLEQDIEETIDALMRAKGMIREDLRAQNARPVPGRVV